MVFQCQQDSFQQEFESTVVSCEPATLTTLSDGKKTKLSGFDVVFENTVLFPEGGGQPCDLGWLADVPVLQVTRRADEAVHFVLQPLPVGDLVKQRVNWERRFDHMQQHSGQHLLSAILESKHGIPTSSWWLGEEESYVELPAGILCEAVCSAVEQQCNTHIREALPVTVSVCSKEDPQLSAAHTRGLPEDHVGPVRIISIQGVDDNLCCGTHVSNLSQLQAIKLLKVEPGKKDKVNLKFLVGDRVLKSLQKCLQKEQALTNILKNDPGKHVELVEKLQKCLKVSNKSLRAALSDVASHETNAIKALPTKPAFICLHRKDGDMDYVKAVQRGLEGEQLFLFLAIGDGKDGGNVFFQGNERDISTLAPRICETLKGKGAGKGSKFQAKVGDLTRISECQKMVESHFSS